MKQLRAEIRKDIYMENCTDKVKKFETLFSDNQYNGSGKTAFVIGGNIFVTGIYGAYYS